MLSLVVGEPAEVILDEARCRWAFHHGSWNIRGHMECRDGYWRMSPLFLLKLKSAFSFTLNQTRYCNLVMR